MSAAVVLPDGTLWVGGPGRRAESGAERDAAGPSSPPAAPRSRIWLRWFSSWPRRAAVARGSARSLGADVSAQPEDHRPSAAEPHRGHQGFRRVPGLQTAAARFARAIRNDQHPRWTPEKTLSFVNGSAGVPGRPGATPTPTTSCSGSSSERSTRTSVDTALQTRLLEPRQLRELVLQPDAKPRGPLARGYADSDGDGTPEPVGTESNYLPTRADATIAWTAGGLAATREDSPAPLTPSSASACSKLGRWPR